MKIGAPVSLLTLVSCLPVWMSPAQAWTWSVSTPRSRLLLGRQQPVRGVLYMKNDHRRAQLTSTSHDGDRQATSWKHPSSRREWLTTTGMIVGGFLTGQPPDAASAKGPPPMSVQETVEAVRFELQDSQGSVGRLQAALEAADFSQLQEITKTMDQSLRKKVVGQAKYYWEDNNAGTQLSNNVTFDLIGINRNARPGQESAEGVQQYLQDLRNDLQQILKYSEEAANAATTSSY